MDKINYESIFNNGHTPMLIIDSGTGEITDSNQAACNYYGYEKDRLLTMQITDINTLSQQDVFEEMRKASNEDRKFFRFRHRMASGEIREVEVYSGPIYNDTGLQLFSIIHDIEDKRKMELTIKRQQSNFEGLYEHSPEAIAMLDNEFKVISVNSSFERIFQYKLEEIKGLNITKVLCDENSYDESSYVKDSIKRGEFVRKETQRRRKDGRLIDVSFLGYPIISDGEQISVYGIYTDMSKIKEEKLEHERKIQMYIRQLKDAKSKAEEASRFKTQFIANMTHEIRTPINGITGLIELMEDTMLSEEQKEYFQLLRYSADRLSSLINDVLEISKIEAGKLELRNSRFNMKQLLNNIAGYYRLQAGRKGLELNCSVDPDIPELLLGDPDRLNQILFNLLSNAVKFTETGHIGLDAEVTKKSDYRVSIRFCVCDTGIGIPEGETEHIFEEFYQLEAVNKRKHGGVGLGLPISRKLVNLMGGDIEVRSGFEKGCAFSFEAGFQICGYPGNTSTGAEVNMDTCRGVLPALDILVVEDDCVNQKVLRRFLEKGNCNVTVAENGKEALEILEQRTFNAILMDIYMPDMTGYDVALLIRKKEASTGVYTPIIAITAAVQEEEREKYLKAGFECCIAKPCGREQIFNAVAGVLGKKYTSPVVCMESMIERLEGDHKLLAEIISEVVSSKYEMEFLGGVEKYIREKNLNELRRHIHKFKGSLSHFQAEYLNALLVDIIENCEEYEFLQAEKLFHILKMEYKRLKECLAAYLEERT